MVTIKQGTVVLFIRDVMKEPSTRMSYETSANVHKRLARFEHLWPNGRHKRDSTSYSIAPIDTANQISVVPSSANGDVRVQHANSINNCNFQGNNPSRRCAMTAPIPKSEQAHTWTLTQIQPTSNLMHWCAHVANHRQDVGHLVMFIKIMRDKQVCFRFNCFSKIQCNLNSSNNTLKKKIY